MKKKIPAGALLCILILCLLILLPLGRIIAVALGEDIWSILQRKDVVKACIGSGIVSGLCIGITVPLAFLCAFSVTHTNIRLKALFSALCTLPLWLPPISFGFSLLSIFGKNGMLYTYTGLRINLLGTVGVVMGLVLYTFPVIFIMFRNSLQQMDVTVYEGAAILNITWFRYMIGIVIPQMKRTMVRGVLLTFAMSLTEYGVCLIVGGKLKTISLLMYRKVLGEMDLPTGTALAIVFLIPVILLGLFDYLFPQRTGKIIYRNLIVPADRPRDILAYIITTVVSLAFLCVVGSFLIMCFSSNYPVDRTFTLHNLVLVLSDPYVRYYWNSLLISTSSAILGCIICFMSAYFTVKGKKNLVSRILYFLSTVSYVIPGMLFGIAYMMTYKGSIIYGSFMILIMVNLSHFFAAPYLLSFDSVNSMSREYEDISRLYTFSRIGKMKDIYLPYMRNTLLDMFFYLFSNSMITISAVVFLYSYRTMPYSLVLSNFEGSQEYLSKSAAVSLLILLTNMVVFAVTSICKKMMKK